MKELRAGIIIGILIVLSIYLASKLTKVQNTLEAVKSNYETELNDIKERFSKEQDSLQTLTIDLSTTVDSLERELELAKADEAQLQEELEDALADAATISTSEAYEETQKLLPTEDPDRSFGYSGDQVTGIHKNLIENDYLKRIQEQTRKQVALLGDMTLTQDFEINVLNQRINSMVEERKALDEKTDSLITDLGDAQADRDRFKNKAKKLGVGLGATSTIIVVGALIILL